jgi:Na+/H+ antiporter NhaD/arsenite permease-like protein
VGKKPFATASSIAGISVFILIASQLLGNVAVVQLAKPNVQELSPEAKRIAWAIISFVSTIGGNLTITGSAGKFFFFFSLILCDAIFCTEIHCYCIFIN